MTVKDWREAFTELADAYYKATGELWPAPISPGTGKPVKSVLVSKERLEEMYLREGMRLREIAEALQCSVSEVSVLLKRAGIPTRKPRDYPTTQAQLEASARNLKPFEPGHAVSAETKAKLSAVRKRRGYEFGGSERKGNRGYIVVYCPEHPRANAAGEVPKHTLIMERHLGRYLEDDEVVHHINHVRDDNRIENLQIMTIREHCRLHGLESGGGRR